MKKNCEAFQLINCFFAPPFLIRPSLKTQHCSKKNGVSYLSYPPPARALPAAHRSYPYSLTDFLHLFYGLLRLMSQLGPAASTSSDLQVFVPVYDKISQNKIRPKPRRADLLRLRPAASHLRHNSCGRLHCRTRCRTLRPTRAWFKYFLMYSDSVAGFCQQSPVTTAPLL